VGVLPAPVAGYEAILYFSIMSASSARRVALP